jgi:hypothetical protein
MKKNTLLKFMVISLSILSLFFFLLSFATTVRKQYGVVRNIPAAEIQKAFLKANADKIPLYIYIVKKSPDNRKNDLDLLFLSADAYNNNIAIGKPWEEPLYKKECAWYVSYLKGKGMSKDSVVLVYHYMITKKECKDFINLEIGVSPFDQGKTYLRLNKNGKVSRIGSPVQTFSDSGCKFPPDCSMFQIPLANQITAIVKKQFNK